MRTFFLCCLGLVACGKSTDNAATVGGTPVVAGSVAVKPVAVAVPAPGVAKTQLAALSDCTSELTCDAFDALVDMGEQAGPDALAYVEDRGHGDARRLAARVLGRIQYAPAGPKLVALANAEPDVMMQIDLFKAAGECGGDATFDALAHEYARENPGDAGEHLVALRDGLKAFPRKALPWALGQMTHADKDPTKYADVMCDVATPADRDTIVALVGTTKNYMIEDRLAAKAISLGATDDKLYDTLLAGLASESDGDRDDAAMFVRAVANKLPLDRKQKAIELIQRALVKADPMLAASLKSSLAKLAI